MEKKEQIPRKREGLGNSNLKDFSESPGAGVFLKYEKSLFTQNNIFFLGSSFSCQFSFICNRKTHTYSLMVNNYNNWLSCLQSHSLLKEIAKL